MRHRHRHHHHPRAASPIVLAMTSVFINIKENFMQVVLTWTTPATRIDGTPLALTDIAATRILRNGTDLAKVIAVTGAMTFTDSSPLTGSRLHRRYGHHRWADLGRLQCGDNHSGSGQSGLSDHGSGRHADAVSQSPGCEPGFPSTAGSTRRAHGLLGSDSLPQT